ncbi:hypothetical protein [Deinococcus arenicola]|uniref:Uncharacterized protein n=1 Tax=Deinococcus arenicola TaxID=2994950 RepID=A0ABU4DVK5_9DEIO|nr:hypothetical protein [Deinococcus sp. ZS9-10]MDV6376470.1 hypothetical protein [Deinococcus sp. ZS9-10]
MNRNERAAQVWAVLAWAARHRQTITYQQLGQAVGLPPVALGKVLDPIQAYCQARKLPPLTVLAVSKETGLPGSGFTAAQAVQVASDQAKVFGFDWLQHGNPQEKGFEQQTPIGLDTEPLSG